MIVIILFTSSMKQMTLLGPNNFRNFRRLWNRKMMNTVESAEDCVIKYFIGYII